MSIFKSGFNSVKAEAKRQEEVKASMGKQLFRLFVKANDTEGVIIRFLNKEPVTFNEHSIQSGKKWINRLCVGENCPYCAKDNRASYKGAFLVWDYRKYEDKEGKKKESGLRLYVAGIKVLTQLMRLAERNGRKVGDKSKNDGLLRYTYQLDRDGTGTSTSYTLAKDEPCDKLSAEEVIAMLPEKLREDYGNIDDNNMEEVLEDIIMEQLKMTLGNNSSDDEENDAKEDEDNDDDDYVDVEDEEEEKPVVKKKKTTLGLKANKSLKTSLKNKISKKRKVLDDEDIPF